MLYKDSFKLFYNKFLYKLEIITPAAFLFRNKDLQTVKNTIDEFLNNNFLLDDKDIEEWPSELSYSSKYFYRRFRPSEDDILQCQKLHNYLSTTDLDAKVRVEINNLSIYSNQQEELSELGKNVNCKWKTFYRPNTKIAGNLKPNTIYHSFADKYKYKVTIGKVYDESLGTFMETNNNNFVKLGPSCLDAIKNKRCGTYNSYYFYVRDEKILNMISMFGFEIKRIEELLPKSDK